MKKAQATMSAIKNGDRKSTRLNSSHTVIYTLSLHVALPIFVVKAARHLWKRRRDHRPVELFHEKGAGHDERDKERPTIRAFRKHRRVLQRYDRPDLEAPTAARLRIVSQARRARPKSPEPPRSLP